MKKIILLVVLLIAGNFLYNKYLKGNDLSNAADALKLLETMKTSLSSSTQISTPPSISTTTPSKGDTLVYFRSVSQSGLSAVVEVDKIEMFGGEEATQAAMKDTGCSKEKVVECAPSLNNAFYIRNTSTSTEKYTVTLSTEVYLWGNNANGEIELQKANLAQLKDAYSTWSKERVMVTPFWITVKNGKILRVEQQYLP